MKKISFLIVPSTVVEKLETVYFFNCTIGGFFDKLNIVTVQLKKQKFNFLTILL